VLVFRRSAPPVFQDFGTVALLIDRATVSAAAPRLELRGVSKSFGATRALSGVSLSLYPGEVHVIAGENGAGKSTLIRILSGVYPSDAGELRLNGVAVQFREPAEAKAAGIATIHQELSLIPSLSITDNVFLARPGRAWAPVSRVRARADVRRLLAWLGLELDPDAAVETLPFSVRQLLEIGRAISEQARVLILDEPTSALSEPEAERLFVRLEELRGQGASIVYISHRMDEIYRLAQRISVLRDGALVLTSPVAELSQTDLVLAMVGRGSTREQGRAAANAVRAAVARSASALTVRDLGCSAEPRFDSLSFEVRPGEIVGLAGLRDSGAQNALRVLSGALHPSSGTVLLGEVKYQPASPAAALASQVAFLPADRKDSVFPELSVLSNATLSALERFTRWGFVERRREREVVSARASELRVKALDLTAPASALSGGNQQKLALLRCLLSEPKWLLLEDPTRGVDVAAKREIYELIRAFAARGMGVLLYSSELDELCSLCDRGLVLFRGRLVASLGAGELTRARLLAALMGNAS
jgi:ABC-type sugar transport system ATPase subunit